MILQATNSSAPLTCFDNSDSTLLAISSENASQTIESSWVSFNYYALEVSQLLSKQIVVLYWCDLRAYRIASIAFD